MKFFELEPEPFRSQVEHLLGQHPGARRHRYSIAIHIGEVCTVTVLLNPQPPRIAAEDNVGLSPATRAMDGLRDADDDVCEAVTVDIASAAHRRAGKVVRSAATESESVVTIE